jgi:preprotein translocase SecE subunit
MAINVQKKDDGSGLQKMQKFLREAYIELKKTSWPSQDELKKSTLLVLGAVFVVTVWIGGLDAILGAITQKLVH